MGDPYDGELGDSYSSPGVTPPILLPLAPVIIVSPGVIVPKAYLAIPVPFNYSHP